MLESECECGFECGFELELDCLRCVTALGFELESLRSSVHACVRVSGLAFEFESELKCLR